MRNSCSDICAADGQWVPGTMLKALLAEASLNQAILDDASAGTDLYIIIYTSNGKCVPVSSNIWEIRVSDWDAHFLCFLVRHERNAQAVMIPTLKLGRAHASRSRPTGTRAPIPLPLSVRPRVELDINSIALRARTYFVQRRRF